MPYNDFIKIGTRVISITDPSYFIADIAANHDGDFERAKSLIFLAKEAGADAVKFQHFKAEKIVSDFGFRALGSQLSHQANWDKSVFEIYRAHELNRDWSLALLQAAQSAGIDFLTTPYDFEAVDLLDAYIPAYKIGSGDITWIELILYVARRNKPIFLATGASTMDDVERAVKAILSLNNKLVLMQCNTNYTGSLENFKHINLNVLRSYAVKFPGITLGLSDHSPGHATVLGAITLGARVIEKHFTDDNFRTGPDHSFSMTPKSWREMVDRSRELEAALGDGVKRIEENEKHTAIVQQRCLRLAHSLPAGAQLTEADLEVLRPAQVDALRPFELATALGRRLKVARKSGEAISLSDLEPS